MFPVLEEIVRARYPIRPDVFRRWQQQIRNEVMPALEAAKPAETSKAKKSSVEVPA